MGKKQPKRIIYVAGPYRAKTEYGIVENIRHAERETIKLWQKGWAVICPHMNTAHLGGCVPDDTWIEGDVEILKRCDAIYMLDGWEKSVGATEERRVALEIGLTVYYETA